MATLTTDDFNIENRAPFGTPVDLRLTIRLKMIGTYSSRDRSINAVTTPRAMHVAKINIISKI